MVAVALTLALADAFFGIRENFTRSSAYAPVSETDDESYERSSRAIRYRIGLLLRPREGKAGIGGDPSSREIEAGLLYGRLAVLEERRGSAPAASAHMARGVSLLKAARHPRPTEEYIREVLVKQDARVGR